MGICFTKNKYKERVSINNHLNHTPVLPRAPIPSEKPNFIALYNYDKNSTDDISIRKHDPLILLNKDHDEWWFVKNLRTQQKGFVPCNYTTSIDNLEIKDWYFGEVSRREAERLLEYLDNETGVFLVRESETDKGNAWALSILDNILQNRKVKHYKIKKTDSGGCYIATSAIFNNLDDLIGYYTKHKALCCLLTKACAKQILFHGFWNSWEESRENIVLGDEIGKGNFGEVYKGTWRGKHTVAVKTLKFNKTSTIPLATRQAEFLKELEINKKLRHEKVVKLWCVCTKDEPMLLITEYMCNGDLLKYLRADTQNKIGFKEIIDIAAQIASGMRYLESMKCVHRDLAARNILVGERNVCKIADFGLAQILDKDKNVLEFAKEDNAQFPIKWTAIEAFTQDPITKTRQYTIKSDVWSFGIVLYELITKGGMPYPGIEAHSILRKIKDEKYRMPKPEGGLCTDYYYGIMWKCWYEDQNDRPTFDWLYNTFNDFNTSSERSYTDT